MRVINVRSVLAVRAPDLPVDESSVWTVTHGLGTPAGGTYTEVVFALDPTGQSIAAGNPAEVIERAVRSAAADLYGQRWAFHYRPDEFARAIEHHRLDLRERLIVTHLEWWGRDGDPDDMS